MAIWDNPVRFTVGGLEAIHAAFVGSGGFCAGFSNLTVLNENTGSGMRRLQGAFVAPFTLQDPNYQAQPGDDGVYDTWEWASANPATGSMEVQAFDYTFANDIEGMVDYVEGIFNFYGRGDSIGNPGLMMYLLTSQAHLKDATGLDQPGFLTEIWLSSRSRHQGRAEARHQTPATDRYSLRFNDAKKTPWGKSLKDNAVMGIATRKAIAFAQRYRYMLHVFIGNGTATDIVVDYPLATEDVNYFKAWRFDTGAALTVSSADDSTNTVVLSAAMIDATPTVLLYPVLTFD